MRLSSAQIKALERENLRWGAELEAIPPEQWPAEREASVRRTAVFRSRKFLVQVFDDSPGAVRITVSRTEWDRDKQRWRENISWDDLQRLKAEAGFGHCWAIELFPADEHIVNVANMRHLWLLDSAPSFAWLRRSAAA